MSRRNPTSRGSASSLPVANSLEDLRDHLRRFATERDWDQFHTPRNLATALSVECAELLEHFQWLIDDRPRSLSAATLEQVRHEMADVLLYLIRLADKLNVDLLEAASLKLELNARKYPVEKARGTSTKYTDL
jgi:NTP pyrophosphatase (non-canonical NTP hydrolase)